MNKDNILQLIILTLLFLISIYVIHIASNQQKTIINFCNEKYGEEKWEWNETTGTIPFYIGQSWECVSLEEQTKK
jgi:hypothetical protein